MKFKKATNQQLYEIAMDDKARMKDRYAAACELQQRKKAGVFHGQESSYSKGSGRGEKNEISNRN